MKRSAMHPTTSKPPAGMSHATMAAGMPRGPMPSKEMIQAKMGIAPHKAKKKGAA